MEVLLNASVPEHGLVLGINDSELSVDVLTSLLDELACGVIVVSADGRVLHANRPARSEAARTGLLQLGGEQGLMLEPEHGRVMHGALAKAAAGSRSLVTFSSETAKVTLAVIPLRGRHNASARVALVFARVAVHEPVMLGFFARTHGLTATEEHVLGILCHGYSAPEVAAQMKLAVSTVRTHVRSICAKTRSCGIRELVNRVAVLPPIASPAATLQRQNQVH